MVSTAKTIEETYQKLSQKEHILKRPGMYIGDVKRQSHFTWFFDDGMKKDTVEYSDGFIKIFDEILTNALDHSMRDTTLSQIKVSYDRETGILEVYNNGQGIPVVMHAEHQIYVPELIFGHLLSGSNYDDTMTRTGAGTNGIGSNCTNIFSKWFKVETVDSTRGLKFEQTYENNMSTIGKSKVSKTKVKGYTKISFLPDYSLFSMTSLDKDTIKVLYKRVYDCIICSPQKVKVFINDVEIKGKGIVDYVKYFTQETPIIETHQYSEYIWEYAVIPNSSFEHISFVNGNSTYSGGKHVDYILNQIISKLKALIEQKKKIKDIKPQLLKDNMFFFLRATVKNPQFNSQTKETLTTQSKDFGVKIEVSDKFIEKLYKTSIVEDAIIAHRSKQTTQLAKQTDGKKLSKIYVPKLEDALWAGTAKSNECSLVLTEGLSAMTFAVWGRSVVGIEKYGIFPLKGKCISIDTRIPLFNGETKLAKDVQLGDILIGDDGTPRKVLTLYNGSGKMYEVHQDRGESYKVNDEHILTLYSNQKQTTVDINIQEFMNMSSSDLMGLRGECVNWDEQETLLDPYILGLWLCDASEAPLRETLEKYNLMHNKHIPKEYLVNSKEIRTALLAGILYGSDTLVLKDGTTEINIKHKRFLEDVIYLCRTLGFDVDRVDDYIIKISRDSRTTGVISISEIPDSDYIGIGIDGNNRFLINDFTVTHNCLNVRDATMDQLANNEEINNIKKIIGLKHGEVYKDTKSLRYGKVIMLTDADVDGKHILGLFINFIHYFWPSLIQMNPSFIQTIKTPIIKAIKNKKAIEFFTEKDFREWSETENVNSYQIRYFKGLGTSTKEDAKEIFKRIIDLKVDYYIKSPKCEKDILLAFDKDKNSKSTVKCSDLRKEWLSGYDKNSTIQLKQNRISYEEFINKELIHFSVYDNLRSIPSLCDGLKPSQRKILYYMLKKNITKSIKVAQLSGYISAETGYHHGEVSLQQAIISMAQDFIGTNNINLLTPDGNFGSRLAGIADAASPRYIFTHLRSVSFDIFDKDDLPLLEYLEDDGLEVEPEWFIPIIPMILVNGCSGIGTGYSTYIPSYNPVDVVKNLLLMLDNKQPELMSPHFKDFKGTVVSVGDGEYEIRGCYTKVSQNTINITEIPAGMWITPYKEFLEGLVVGDSKKTIGLNDVKNLSKDENLGINFEVQLTSKLDDKTVYKNLKLIKKINTNNMYLFNKDRVLTKYNNVLDILKEYFFIRLEFYEKRRQYLISKIQKELDVYTNKKRFIEMYIKGHLDINRKKIDTINQILEEKGFMRQKDSYDYLTSIQISSLSEERIKTLEDLHSKAQAQLDYYTDSNAKSLWKIDLKNLYKKI
jgi:DNA gyrase/topoisomerase IV subunit B